MNRRSFLRLAGLAPLGMVVGPVVGYGALLNDDRLPNTEEEVKKRLAEIERKVGVGKDGNSALCLENGQPYQTIVQSNSGSPVKREGKPITVFPNKKAAWAGWFAAFRAYHSYHRGKLHWRCRPELHRATRGCNNWDPVEMARAKEFTGYYVYARLVADDL